MQTERPSHRLPDEAPGIPDSGPAIQITDVPPPPSNATAGGSGRTSTGLLRKILIRLFLISLVLAVLALIWGLLPSAQWSAKGRGPLTIKVQRRNFIHEITERGTVESASNVEVRCEVKSRNSSGIQILYIVPEGTYVTPVPDWEPADPENPEDPPDLLVTLDSSALESEQTQKQIVCANSESAVIQAKNTLETAKITMDEYLHGTYVEKKKEFAAAVAVAEENFTRAEEYYEYSRLLHSKGYISDKELQANAFDVEKKSLDRDKSNTSLEVLEKYSKPKMLLELEADIGSAEAKLNAAEQSYQLDLEELALVDEQVVNCTIRAPEAGQVVYANITDRRGGTEVIIEEGTTVRERQVIIKLPDPKRMQVTASVNEAKITLVKPGMFVEIRLDAFAELKLEGVVERVNKYPAPTSFFSSSVKEYETTIRIKNGKVDHSADEPAQVEAAGEEEELAELRPGMTAEVKIRVEEFPDVLQVPVQAVIEHGGKHYCIVLGSSGVSAQEVEIGSTNDKTVVIHKGLDEGDEVVLNAASHREDASLPAPTEAEKAVQLRGQGLSSDSGDDGDSQDSDKQSPSQRAEQLIKERDSNGNGKLETDEMPSGMKTNASEADTDGDGVITLQELTAVMAKMSGAGRPGGRAQGEGPGPKGAGGRPDGGGPRGPGKGAGGRAPGGPGGPR